MMTSTAKQAFISSFNHDKPHKHLIKSHKNTTGTKFLAYKVIGLDAPFQFVIRRIDGRYTIIETNDIDHMALMLVEYQLFSTIQDAIECLSQWGNSWVH